MTGLTTLTVAIESEGPESEAHRTALASLPRRFRVVDGKDAHVVVVDGAPPDWPDRVMAASRAGARAVVVSEAGDADAAALSEVAAAVGLSGTAVVIDPAHALARAWEDLPGGLRRMASTAGIIDSVMTVRAGVDHSPTQNLAAQRAALVNQLAVVRPIAGRIRNAVVAHTSELSYCVVATVNEVHINLTGVISHVSAGELQVNVVGSEQRWCATFPPVGLARPVELVRFDESGAHALPEIWESARRSLWVQLHEQVVLGRLAAYSLTDYALDSKLVRDLLGV